jgi:hypothetical protein
LKSSLGVSRLTITIYNNNNNNNNNNKVFLSQARWGRLEMKLHMKTSELNPKEKKRETKAKENDETRKHIKKDKTHKNQQDLKGYKKRSNDHTLNYQK